MTKSKQSASINEATVDAPIADLAANDPDGDGDRVAMRLMAITLGEATTDFASALSDVITIFKLKYNSLPESRWAIEDELQSTFPTTPCFMPLMESYSKNFHRSSKAVCRTAINFMLNECLTVIKNNHPVSEASPTGDHQANTLTPWEDIRVYGDVSFTHDVTLETTATSSTSAHERTITGRLDYSIGRVLAGIVVAQEWRIHRFQSFLIIIGAKTSRDVDKAKAQLLIYLACLRQSRVRARRTDTSVYGVASNGYLFDFVTITHDGTIKISKRFNASSEDILKVLGCLRHILEITASINPNATPDMGEDADDCADCADYGIDISDNQYEKQAQQDEDYAIEL